MNNQSKLFWIASVGFTLMVCMLWSSHIWAESQGATKSEVLVKTEEPPQAKIEHLIDLAERGTLTDTELHRIQNLTKEPLIDSLDHYLTNQEHPFEKRWLTAMILARLGGSEAKTKLSKRLQDKTSLIRMAAVKGFEVMGDRTVVPELHPLLHDNAMVVRAATADALGYFADRSSLPLLAKELRQQHNFHRGKSLWVRKHLIRAIGNIGGSDSIPPLIACLEEKEPEIIQAAIQALNPASTMESPEEDMKEIQQEWLAWWKQNQAPMTESAAPTSTSEQSSKPPENPQTD